MSAFERYKNDMTPEEAASYGLPAYGDARLELVSQIEELSIVKDQQRTGSPSKGFDLALRSLKIITGQREAFIVHTGEKEIIRPATIHVVNDEPLWKGFGLVFPRMADALSKQMHVSHVPDIQEIFQSDQPTELASHAGMLLVAQSMEVAIFREPSIQIWATNPDSHIMLTFESAHNTINRLPTPSE